MRSLAGRILFEGIFVIAFLAAGRAVGEDKGELTRHVDPFIGTGGHGHTYPGATTPFGMVQLSPDTRLTGWDGCSGYHYSDSYIYGFSHTHLSGTGCSDYGDILVMPLTGPLRLDNGAEEGVDGYRSGFSHERETARPGFYSVYLQDHRVMAELTVTPRCGFHRYTFPKVSDAKVIIDLTHRDEVIHSGIKLVGERRVEGFRRSSAWAKDQRVYFSAEFSRAPGIARVVSAGKTLNGADLAAGRDIKGYFTFDTSKENGREVLLKIGISPVSIEGARRNLEAEIPDWDFVGTAKEAEGAWEEALSRIRVEGGSEEQKKTFYTALYHTMLCPNLFTDVDGRYRGMDKRIHRARGYTHYTVFSLWDTYRALHPLFTIIERERSRDLVKTLIKGYEKGGRLPVWELAANETDCMIGYHSVPVIADAYIKGIRGFDAVTALEAMKHSASLDHFGLVHYRKHGYIPSEKEGESVSKTLEYAYDDWCIAVMAREMGRDGDYRRYIKRAQYYKNLFDPVTGFMRARKNGGGVEPFDPAEVNLHYTEGNSWQYSFYAPQDIHGLASLIGGPAAFEEKLDGLFGADTPTSGLGLPDVSGLIGQYAHGNEPSHHMAYLYDFIGRPHKTQARVREIMNTMYSARPDGLCGNEDCGQMSAWYVLSALGFYPVTPGSDLYAIGSPLFERAVISLENGEEFLISARENSGKTPYWNSAVLNGDALDSPFIKHGDILKGGELAFQMSAEPAVSGRPRWSAGDYSKITDEPMTPAPWFIPAKRTFSLPFQLELICAEDGADLYYSDRGGLPGPDEAASKVYEGPLRIEDGRRFLALALMKGAPSFPVSADFRRIPEDMDLELRTSYSTMYPAGGDFALIDGIRGGNDFRTGAWQGYQGVDLYAVVDLGKERPVKRISAGFIQDQNSWIFLPSEVLFSVSSDGSDFQGMAELGHNVPLRLAGPVIKEFTADRPAERVRYVRVIARNIGVCPEWHKGAGHKAWIFADEITVE